MLSTRVAEASRPMAFVGGAPSCRRTTETPKRPDLPTAQASSPHPTPGSSEPSERVGDNRCLLRECVPGSRSLSPTAIKVGAPHGFLTHTLQPARSPPGEGPPRGSRVPRPRLDPPSPFTAADPGVSGALGRLPGSVLPLGFICWAFVFRLRHVSLARPQLTGDAHSGFPKWGCPTAGTVRCCRCRSDPGRRYCSCHSPATGGEGFGPEVLPLPALLPGGGTPRGRCAPSPPSELASNCRASSAPTRPPTRTGRSCARVPGARHLGFPGDVPPCFLLRILPPRLARGSVLVCCLCWDSTSAPCLQVEAGSWPPETRGGGGRGWRSPRPWRLTRTGKNVHGWEDGRVSHHPSGGGSPRVQFWTTPCP